MLFKLLQNYVPPCDAFQPLLLNLPNASCISSNLPDLLASSHSTMIPSHHSLSILCKKIFCSLLAFVTLASATSLAPSSFLLSLPFCHNLPLFLSLSTSLSLSLTAFPILPLNLPNSSLPIIYGYSTPHPASSHTSLAAVSMTPPPQVCPIQCVSPHPFPPTPFPPLSPPPASHTPPPISPKPSIPPAVFYLLHPPGTLHLLLPTFTSIIFG